MGLVLFKGMPMEREAWSTSSCRSGLGADRPYVRTPTPSDVGAAARSQSRRGFSTGGIMTSGNTHRAPGPGFLRCSTGIASSACGNSYVWRFK